MRISDWSSDVCSSDLSQGFRLRVVVDDSGRVANAFEQGLQHASSELAVADDQDLAPDCSRCGRAGIAHQPAGIDDFDRLAINHGPTRYTGHGGRLFDIDGIATDISHPAD